MNSASVRRSRHRKQLLLDRMGDDAFSGAQWLLAYEALLNGWIDEQDVSNYKISEFMREMIASKVGFFDSNAAPSFISVDSDGGENVDDYAIEDMSGRYDDDDDDDDGGDASRQNRFDIDVPVLPWRRREVDDTLDDIEF